MFQGLQVNMQVQENFDGGGKTGRKNAQGFLGVKFKNLTPKPCMVLMPLTFWYSMTTLPKISQPILDTPICAFLLAGGYS